MLTALAGRAPVVLAALVVAAAVAADYAARGAVATIPWREAALLAATAPAFVGLARGLSEVRKTLVALQPLLNLFDFRPGPSGGPDGTPLPRLPAAIAIRRLSFSFPRPAGQPTKPVLAAVTTDWRPGQILLLRGPNGSGKTTLLRLLLGLGRPSAGAITIAGTDLFDLDLRAWRRSVAYLPQRPYLAERASVREAIRLLVQEATDRSIQAALQRVGLWETLALRAPADPLSVLAGALSVGQRQRLALARVLCQDAKTLILDEPDSGLDREGIALVADLVREFAKDGMVALAAHDPTLIALGDTILALGAATSASEGEPPPPVEDPPSVSIG